MTASLRNEHSKFHPFEVSFRYLDALPVCVTPTGTFIDTELDPLPELGRPCAIFYLEKIN
jgi:hypothetical protein